MDGCKLVDILRLLCYAESQFGKNCQCYLTYHLVCDAHMLQPFRFYLTNNELERASCWWMYWHRMDPLVYSIAQGNYEPMIIIFVWDILIILNVILLCISCSVISDCIAVARLSFTDILRCLLFLGCFIRPIKWLGASNELLEEKFV